MIDTKRYSLSKKLTIDRRFKFPYILLIEINLDNYGSQKYEQKEFYKFMVDRFGPCGTDWNWQKGSMGAMISFKEEKSLTYLMLFLEGS